MDININTLALSKSHVVDYLNLFVEVRVDCLIDSATSEECLLDKLVSTCIDQLNIRAPYALIRSIVIVQKSADHFIVACRCALGRVCRSAPNPDEQSL